MILNECIHHSALLLEEQLQLWAGMPDERIESVTIIDLTLAFIMLLQNWKTKPDCRNAPNKEIKYMKTVNLSVGIILDHMDDINIILECLTHL